jgi:flagellar export protein FliJ
MKRFVFRAQAALDLRKMQEESALQALALAESRERDAESALDEAERLLVDMLQRGHAEDATGDLSARIWRRNWIAGQRQRIARCHEVVAQCRTAAADARGRAQLARRKSKSLERYKDRVWHTYTREEAREEQKVLDELGVTRFALGRCDAGGNR